MRRSRPPAPRCSRCRPTSPTPSPIDQAFRAIEETFGPVELLVNNAGITRDGLLMRMSDEHWGDVSRPTSPAPSTPSAVRRPR